MTHRIQIAIALLLFFSTGVAQELLTMDGAVGIALERSHQLQAANFDRTSATWGKRTALTNFLPRVELASEATRIDAETDRRANAAIDFIRGSAPALGIPPSALQDIQPLAYRNSYSSTVTVVQPLYNGGAELVRLDAANAMQDRAEYAYADAEQEVVAGVRTAYLTVLKVEEMLALAKESAERTRRWLSLTQRQADLGSRTHTDVMRFEVQLASDEGSIVEAENGLALAKLQLNEVMGVDLNTVYTLQRPGTADSSMADSAEAAPGELRMTPGTEAQPGMVDEDFLARHPSYQVAEAGLRLADIQVDQSWVNFKPRINLAFQYGWERNGTLALDGIRPWALSLSVRFPLFNGFGDYTTLQKSKADLQRTEEQVQTFRRALVMRARNAGLSVGAAAKRTEIARVGLTRAREVLLSMTRRYEAGAASNVDLIDAQTAFVAARAALITSVYDRLIAGVQFARATGSIDR
jgi:outer membrane protein